VREKLEKTYINTEIHRAMDRKTQYCYDINSHQIDLYIK
jgi:hypothetical protein